MRNTTQNLQTGDSQKDEVFNRELLPHADSLFNYAYRLTQNREDAEDLLQDALMRAHRYQSYYQQGTNAKSWLFKIMQNHYINNYRKKARQPQQVDIEDVMWTSDWSVKELAYESFNYDFGDEVMNGLNALNEELRMIIILKDVEGFKYEEISKIMDIPMGTVKSSLFRARNMMKDRLTARFSEKLN